MRDDEGPDDDLTSWLISAEERGNVNTVLDDRHPDGRAWSRGNRVRPLVHGATYFQDLFEHVEATREGDLIYFTDWQGDADELLTGEPGSEVADVLARADERGVDVRGLVWRSHPTITGFSGSANHRMGRQLQKRDAEALLDMRVRTGGSHHQKLVVIRHRDDASRDIAYVGGIDLCHSRRDTAEHLGDPQALDLADEYGDTPPWHDIQAAITGPAVHDVETVFRERWLDPTPLSRSPIYYYQDKLRGYDVSPDPLPVQAPPPPEVPAEDGGTHVVQLLRTYPNLRKGRDYPFARGGERSVARGYTKALAKARHLVYVEDQYLWGVHIGDAFVQALREHPDLKVIAVVPLFTDQAGPLNRTPQLLGRRRAMLAMEQAAPGRFAVYGLENHASTPVYVHAKCCVMDDTWASIGSDNFNRRSWTHDSELSAVVIDEDRSYARDLRLGLAAEHLDSTPEEVQHLADPDVMFETYAASAAALDAWHAGGRQGPRPPGRLRRQHAPELSRFTRAWATVPYLLVHDPDGRPKPLRKSDGY